MAQRRRRISPGPKQLLWRRQRGKGGDILFFVAVTFFFALLSPFFLPFPPTTVQPEVGTAEEGGTEVEALLVSQKGFRGTKGKEVVESLEIGIGFLT